MIAACSVKRDHEHPFAAEYVVPQLVLQWVMEEQECAGIRFFSTHVRPDETEMLWAMNYVFPAIPPPDVGHSQQLRNLFELTDPCLWQGMHLGNRFWIGLGGWGWRSIMMRQFQHNTQHLANLPRAPI